MADVSPRQALLEAVAQFLARLRFVHRSRGDCPVAGWPSDDLRRSLSLPGKLTHTLSALVTISAPQDPCEICSTSVC